MQTATTERSLGGERRGARATRWLLVGAVVWLLAVVSGLGWLWAYKLTPGVAAVAPRAWPAQTSVQRASPGHSTLVMLAHPKCACTRASIAELARLMSGLSDLLEARVVFLKPTGTPQDWAESDSWRAAAAIPGVSVQADVDGVEASRFGAAVSGQVEVFDAQGVLAFSGGITNARGHEGPSAGARRITAIVRGAAADRADSPVFGCALSDETAQGAM